MGQVPKLKRLSREELRHKLALGTVLIAIGAILAVGSVAMAILMNADRYGGYGVESVSVAAKVTGIEQSFEEEEQADGYVSQGRWLLQAEFQYGGETHGILLDEGYVDESYASQRIGATMEVYVDADTFERLYERPFSFLFLAPLAAGIVAAVSGMLVRFRYSDYRARLLPGRRRRVSGQASPYVMRRGRGI